MKCEHNVMVYESQNLDNDILIMTYHCSNKKCKRKQKETYKLVNVQEYDGE